MTLEIINALIQAGVGVLGLLVLLAFIYALIWRFPENSAAARQLAEQIRGVAQAGVERVEGANTVLMESVRMLQEVNRAATESRGRLETQYENLRAELAEVKKTFEVQLKAKDDEIARLKVELAKASAEKQQALDNKRAAEEALAKAIAERDALKVQIEALERAGKLEPDIKPAEGNDDEKAAA